MPVSPGRAGVSPARPAPSGCCRPSRPSRPSVPALPRLLRRKIRPLWRIRPIPGGSGAHLAMVTTRRAQRSVTGIPLAYCRCLVASCGGVSVSQDARAKPDAPRSGKILETLRYVEDCRDWSPYKPPRSQNPPRKRAGPLSRVSGKRADEARGASGPARHCHHRHCHRHHRHCHRHHRHRHRGGGRRREPSWAVAGCRSSGAIRGVPEDERDPQGRRIGTNRALAGTAPLIVCTTSRNLGCPRNLWVVTAHSPEGCVGYGLPKGRNIAFTRYPPEPPGVPHLPRKPNPSRAGAGAGAGAGTEPEPEPSRSRSRSRNGAGTGDRETGHRTRPPPSGPGMGPGTGPAAWHRPGGMAPARRVRNQRPRADRPETSRQDLRDAL